MTPLLINSLIIGLLVSPILMINTVNHAHAITKKWGYESSTATSDNGNLIIYSDISDSTIITLGGAHLNNSTNKNLFVFDSNLSLVGSTLNATGTNANIKLFGGYSTTSAGITTVSHNSVTLSGIVNATSQNENVTLAGSDEGAVSTGNTLILDKATLRLVGAGTVDVKNFENYIFRPSYENISPTI